MCQPGAECAGLVQRVPAWCGVCQPGAACAGLVRRVPAWCGVCRPGAAAQEDYIPGSVNVHAPP